MPKLVPGTPKTPKSRLYKNEGNDKDEDKDNDKDKDNDNEKDNDAVNRSVNSQAFVGVSCFCSDSDKDKRIEQKQKQEKPLEQTFIDTLFLNRASRSLAKTGL